MLSVNNKHPTDSATSRTREQTPMAAAPGSSHPSAASLSVHMQPFIHHYAGAPEPGVVQLQAHSQVPKGSTTSTDHVNASFGSSVKLHPLPTPPQSLHHLPITPSTTATTPPNQQSPHAPTVAPPLAFNVTHLTNPPLGYSWGPSAYLRSALSEDMWRVAVDVLVETRLLAHCNFAVASDTLMANVPGLTGVPIDPHMPRASGSGAQLVSLEFAVAVLVGFAEQRASAVGSQAPAPAPAPPGGHGHHDRLDLSKLLAMRVAYAIDAVRALSAKYDHAQYARAVQHNALVSWLSRAAGQYSGLDPSPSGGTPQGHGMGGLEDLIEEDEDDEEDEDAIQVDSKLSSSSYSSQALSCSNSALFRTPSSEALAASIPNSSPLAASHDRGPDNMDTDDPMDCDEGGTFSFASPIAQSAAASASAPASTHSATTPPNAAPAPPSLFVVFADSGRICRATGTADVIQALVQLTDILPWVTQMRSEFGRHFVLLHVVSYAEAIAAAENASPSAGLGNAGQAQAQAPAQPTQHHQHHVQQAHAFSHHASHPPASNQPHADAQQQVRDHTQQQPAHHAQPQLQFHSNQQPYQHPAQQQQPMVQQQGASIEALLSAAHLLN